MLNIFHGDVIKAFEEKYDMLVHGCNCFCTMGAGIARTLSRKWPAVLMDDRKTKRGDTTKLGNTRIVEVMPDKYVVNAYTQFGIGNKALNTQAFKDCFKEIEALYTSKGKKVCMPAVGMGLAEGKPEKLVPILQEIFEKSNIDMYVLTDTREFTKYL